MTFRSILPEPHDIAGAIARQFDGLINTGEWKDQFSPWGSKKPAEACCAALNLNPASHVLHDYAVFPFGDRQWIIRRKCR